MQAAATATDQRRTPPDPQGAEPRFPLAATTNALSLGWQMAELYHARFSQLQPRPPAPPERLPGVSRLLDYQQTGLAIGRADARLAALNPLILAAGQSQPDVQTLRDCYTKTQPAAEDGHAEVYRLHVTLLQTLSATDFRLGTAYSLGRALADSSLRPSTADEVKRAFRHERLDNLRAWLNDLASALPDHSAKAVLQSLISWEAWAANLPSDGHGEVSDQDLKVIRATLHRQGPLWRSVLTGEKAGRDLLTDDDYLQAGRALIARTRTIAWNLLKHIGIAPLAGVVAAIALTVALVPGSVAQLATILGSVAAGLGLTWKAISDGVKRAATKLEQPLWGAELDAAVAIAVTYLPPVGPPEPDIRLLDETPFLLRVLHATGEATPRRGATRAEFTTALTAVHDRNRKKGSADDRRTLRAWQLRRAAPAEDAIVYWIAWAQAAGYVHALDDTHYDVTDEGQRVAQIPRGREGTTRAALAADRPAALAAATDAQPTEPEPAQQPPADAAD